MPIVSEAYKKRIMTRADTIGGTVQQGLGTPGAFVTTNAGPKETGQAYSASSVITLQFEEIGAVLEVMALKINAITLELNKVISGVGTPSEISELVESDFL